MLETSYPRKPSPDPRRTRVDKLKEQHRQLAERIKDIESRERLQARKDDTARKIEAGALAIEHALENPESEFRQVLQRLLNQNVRDFRRRLFEDFGIDAKPPRGSNAERLSRVRAVRSGPPVEGNPESEKPATLKDQFPG